MRWSKFSKASLRSASQAGRVHRRFQRKVASAIKFKANTVRASKKEPPHLIKSGPIDHLAMHRGAVLKKLKSKP